MQRIVSDRRGKAEEVREDPWFVRRRRRVVRGAEKSGGGSKAA